MGYGSNNTNKLSPQEQGPVLSGEPPSSNNTNKLSPQEQFPLSEKLIPLPYPDACAVANGAPKGPVLSGDPPKTTFAYGPVLSYAP